MCEREVPEVLVGEESSRGLRHRRVVAEYAAAPQLRFSRRLDVHEYRRTAPNALYQTDGSGIVGSDDHPVRLPSAEFT